MVRRIAIACGGTLGHLAPALAVEAAYRRHRPDLETLFLAHEGGSEARRLERLGRRIGVVPAAPFHRTPLRRPLALQGLLQSFRHARCLFGEWRPDLVLGFGGYVSAGVMLAACRGGLPTAIHESNVRAGLTNRLLGALVDRVYLGFAATRASFPLLDPVVVGTPVRPDVAPLADEERSPPNGGARRILVLGGSEGSRFLDRMAPELLGRLAGRGLALEVRHQAGVGSVTEARAAYQRRRLAASVEPFIEDIAAAYRWADFAIACPGSATLAELAAAGLPSLLVPRADVAGQHQETNARTYAQAGAATWARERAFQPEAVAAGLERLLGDPGAWRAAAASARGRSAPRAANEIVLDCERLIARRPLTGLRQANGYGR